MVKINVVRSCNTELVKAHPLVAVVIGGTSGIGEHTLQALAATHSNVGKGLRMYIVGRKEASGERVKAECLKTCPTADIRFIRADDLSLLKDVDRVCTEIISSEEVEAKKTGTAARIDFLAMTHAIMYFDGRRETTEGIDQLMSLLYYSRARFTMQLLPLLLASPLPARVVSVFGPGRDAKWFPEDISLRDPKKYGFMPMGSHAAYMITFFFERLAAEHPGRLSLTHHFPGLVITDGFNDPNLPTWFRYTQTVMKPLVRPFTVPQMDAGHRVLFHTSSRFPARPTNGEKATTKTSDGLEVATSSDGILGGGAYRTGPDSELIPTNKDYKNLRAGDWSEKFWEHTMKAFKTIEAGEKFVD